ncbi:NAD(P)-dependent oxidoreductase [Actinomycetospora termitidis]|uniref:NAD(P)-binding domain-containing protein n=1 Tax=Actinomycetospora termitidis TaxID=3053470 RepID=A0ABT7M6B9_9PSEU|nr:NAD(P)-binding domain-containing protein [Actinomycetospora sp. Odt1-22]MDL5156216.1 NAD(P)-binding domain-containing protein [Actinomycetospora sp. Odt1-22]
MRVAVLGTGAIGTGMVHSLLRAGHAVTAWNRTPQRARPLADDGAVVVEDLADAVARAEVVVVVVFDLDAVLSVLSGIAGAAAEDAVVVCSATVGAEIDAVAETATRLGLDLVEAPVLGNAGPAERGELSVMAAGDEALRPRVAPVLDALAATVTWIGDHPGPANRVKLAANAWVSTLNVAMSQAVALATGLGVDPRHFFTVVAGTAADSPYLAYKRAVALGEDDTVSTPTDAIRKDVALIGAAARAAGLPTDVVDLVDALYARLSASGDGARDMARLARTLDHPVAAIRRPTTDH